VVNLFATIPASDRGKGAFAAFGIAMAAALALLCYTAMLFLWRGTAARG
jgi:hypothetical protein